MFNGLTKMLLSLTLVLLLFPSCIKYYKVSNIETHQGHNHFDGRKPLDGNKKRLAIYDQFITQAIFDVLYLKDVVRLAYADDYCDKNGLDLNYKKNLYAKEMELDKHWITFYILADIRSKYHDALTDPHPAWSMYLEFKNGAKISPLSIKEVTLDPIYQNLFGSSFNSFKRSYEVKFSAKDLNNSFYLKKNEPFKLFFSSAYKDSAIVFNYNGSVSEYDKSLNSDKKSYRKNKRIKTKKRKLLENEDFYWI